VANIKITYLERVSRLLKKDASKKFISLDYASNALGIYSDDLGDSLMYFSPMILMDPSINLKSIEPAINEYLEKAKAKKEKMPKRLVVTKKELKQFNSIGDFVYQKFTTVGGLCEKSIVLSDQDLLILRKLVEKETKDRRAAKRALAKKKKSIKSGK
jgi:hypothetical protein